MGVDEGRSKVATVSCFPARKKNATIFMRRAQETQPAMAHRTLVLQTVVDSSQGDTETLPPTMVTSEKVINKREGMRNAILCARFSPRRAAGHEKKAHTTV